MNYWRQTYAIGYGDIITVSTNSVINNVCKSTITHTVTVRNFEVMADKLKVNKICT
jgi:hypothetical protein